MPVRSKKTKKVDDKKKPVKKSIATKAGKIAASSKRAATVIDKAEVPNENSLQKKARLSNRDRNMKRCVYCGSKFEEEAKIFLVEEDLAREFCSESCIMQYFLPEVEHFDREYQSIRSKNDFTQAEQERFSDLKRQTIEAPHAVWRQKAISGHYYYYLISEYIIGNEKVWYICVALFLNHGPSFLFLGVATRDPKLLGHYQRGESLRVDELYSRVGKLEEYVEGSAPREPTDGVASDGWSNFEVIAADLRRNRKTDDIPISDYPKFQKLVQPTLDSPEEVWVNTVQDQKKHEVRMFHFIKSFEEKDVDFFWFIVVARELEETEEIEIVDCVPTIDPDLVDQYRRGTQEVGAQVGQSNQRMVH